MEDDQGGHWTIKEDTGRSGRTLDDQGGRSGTTDEGFSWGSSASSMDLNREESPDRGRMPDDFGTKMIKHYLFHMQ